MNRRRVTKGDKKRKALIYKGAISKECELQNPKVEIVLRRKE